MDGIYAYGPNKEKIPVTYTQKKTKRFDFSSCDNELLVMKLGNDQYLRLLGDGEDLVVDIRKKTKGKFHTNGLKISAKTFRLAAAKLIDELNDLEAKEAEESAKNRVITSNFNIKTARPMPENFTVPYKPKGNESVIFYAK